MRCSKIRMKTNSKLTGLILTLTFCLYNGLNTHAQEKVRVQSGGLVTLNDGADLTISGGITLENGSLLANAGIIRLKENATSTPANWIDSTITSYNYGTGKVVFNGSNGHILSSKNIFNRIDINATGNVTLNSNVNTNKLFLVKGKINTTSSFKLITLSNAQLAVEADASNPNFSNSWVNGSLRRFISPASINNYIFPVGDAAKSNIAVIDNLTANPLNNVSFIDASFGPKPGNDTGLIATENGQAYTSVSNGGVWYLKPDVQPSAGKYDALFYFNGFSGLSDNSFGILKRLDTSLNAADWSVPVGNTAPMNCQPGLLVSSGYAKRINLNSFGQFGIGVFFSPVTFGVVDFDALRINETRVRLKWQTVIEQNNLGFDIERRLEGEPAFTRVGFAFSQANDGNSNVPVTYNFTDANGFGGTSYYRLKQINRTNCFSYTRLVPVGGRGNSQLSLLIYPNPSNGQFTLRLDGVNKTYEAFITDFSGKVIRQLKLTNNSSINISGLNVGQYIIRIPDVINQGKYFSEKIVVIR